MKRGMLVALWLLGGCGSSSDDPSSPGGDADAAVPQACEHEVCLDAPEQGLQIRSVGRMIPPGMDVEYCEPVQLPGGPDDFYYVNHFESVMSEGSHHLIVSAVEIGSPTEANIGGADDVRPCIGARVFGEDLLPVTGQQLPTHEEKFPAGVGRVYQGGQWLVFDYHYLNSTDEPLAAEAVVNFHTVDADQIQHVARSFGFYNFNIPTPVGESTSFTAQCEFDHDVVVHKLTRHTHQWGRDFSAWYAGGPKDGELVWTTPSYEEDVDHVFAEPVTMPAGSGFSFECNFVNTSDHPLQFGVKATDEMCILFGTWWEAPGSGTAGSQSCRVF